MNVTLIMNLGDGEKEAGRHRVESEDMKLGDMTSEDRTRTVRSPPERKKEGRFKMENLSPGTLGAPGAADPGLPLSQGQTYLKSGHLSSYSLRCCMLPGHCRRRTRTD